MELGDPTPAPFWCSIVIMAVTDKDVVVVSVYVRHTFSLNRWLGMPESKIRHFVRASTAAPVYFEQ